ncbi:MAG: PfkB family carbohydrate kinase [Treponemataceae bacterium]|nr:PfkB family carbohydrate kinase [Treponemataceae bacterium]
MKKILVLGSTVVDVIVGVESLPKTGEDANTTSHRLQLGGCAWNVSDILRHSGTPHLLCSPVGQGAYGTFVESQMKAHGVTPFVRLPDENGCCYCFVEASGERTFIAYHGCEYSFDPAWMKTVSDDEFDTVYFCGLELEEKTGPQLTEWITGLKNKTVVFAPSSRVGYFDKSLLQKIFASHPVLHISESEAATIATMFRLTDGRAAQDLQENLRFIHSLTGNLVIVTAGGDGCWYMDSVNEGPQHVPGVKASVVDTIGAGDSHCGAFLAMRSQNKTVAESLAVANKVAATVVGVSGANLTKSQFDAIQVQ